MKNMDRRTMLCAIAVAVLAAASRAPAARAYSARWFLPAGRVPAPAGVLTRLPGDGNQVALTVDDGISVDVVAAYAQFCRDSGTRLTFFVNGTN
ncbi:MAG: polysaccharide deacetylase family protein, partial [Mycobacterium sp.]